MKYLTYSLLCIATVLLQVTLFRFFAIQKITPDLLLILIIFISIREGQVAGILFGFFAGLLDDLTTANIVGLSAISKSFAGYIAGFFYGIKSGLDIKFIGLIILICAIAHEFVLSIVASFGASQSYWFAVTHHSIPQLIYSSILGFILFAFIPKKVWKGSHPEWFEEN